MTDKVAQPSKAITAMRAASQAIVDLTQGGDHMREMGQAYLPKFELESEEAYKARRESSSLFDGVGKTIEDMSGKVFEIPIEIDEASPQKVAEWSKNIDLQGRDLSRFARDLFDEAQKTGVSYILVDAPPRPAELTAPQAAAGNYRPYFNLLTIHDILGWKWQNVANVPTLTQLRLMESVEEDDPDNPYATATVDQVRVLDKPVDAPTVTVTIFRKNKAAKWVEYQSYPTGMDKIMLSACDIGRNGFMTAKPVHSRLAEVNLAHWRLQSDKSSCLHKSLAPLLLLRGIDIDDKAIASAGYAFNSQAEFADLKWAEITGAGIAEARTELKDLEFQMQAMGLQIVMPRSGQTTATGDVIDEGKTNSRLAAWADIMKDALELAYSWMLELGGVSGEVSVVVNKDYASSMLSHLDLAELNKMHLARVISKTTYINEAKRRNVLSEDVDPDLEADMLGDEPLDEPE